MASRDRAQRGEPVRQRIVDAAERLLREGRPEFSMRQLAQEADVSFATPFNQFGNKTAIMHELSIRRIAMMAERFDEVEHPLRALDRVLIAIDTAVAIMLEEPAVSRSYMGWIGAAGPTPGTALERSSALWRKALGDGEGLIDQSEESLGAMARRLAFGFRGTLSFWTAGEITDQALGPSARDMATQLLRNASSAAAES